MSQTVVSRWTNARSANRWIAYAIVESEKGVIANNVHERADHAIGAIGSSCLKPDLLMVSASSFSRARSASEGQTYLYYTSY